MHTSRTLLALACSMLFVPGLGMLMPPARTVARAAAPAQMRQPEGTETGVPEILREDQTLATSTPTRTPTPVNIGNFVWDDLDADGRQDPGEPGRAGVTVQLWNTSKTQLIDTQVTSASGNYTVVAPQPGSYRIRVILQSAGDAFSPKDQAGGDDTDDSDINPTGTNLGFTDVIDIASNVISTTSHDAGLIIFRTATPTRTPTPINIGNFVWIDLDADGIQDPGEPGLGGVTMQLWNSARTHLIAATQTNSNGNYTLVAPIPGDYRIRCLPPAGALRSPANQGADDTKDSDILTSGASVGFSNVFTIASNVISTTVHDCGFTNVPATPIPTMTRTPTLTPVFTPTATNTLLPDETPSPEPTLDPEGAVPPVVLPIVMR